MRQLRQVRRPRLRSGGRRHCRRSRRERPGREEDHLPAARLGRLAPAVLGHADSHRPLSRLRGRSGSGEGPARRAAGGLRARRRRQSAREARGFRRHDVPEMRRSREARDRHARHVRRLVVVLHALCVSRCADDGRCAQRLLEPDGPVHRGHRARDPAPALRALLDQGDARHGARQVRRALHAADDAGDAAQSHLLPPYREGWHRLLRAGERRRHARRGGPRHRRPPQGRRAARRVRRRRHDVEVEAQRRRSAGHHRASTAPTRRACS